MWLINESFARYWFSHFSSSFSHALTSFLIPFIGVSLLGASAFEMGVLVAIQETPVILFSLPIGLWIDRIDLRRALFLSLFAQSAVVGIMGGLLFGNWRSMELLYATAALIGTVKLVNDLTGTTYIPALVARQQLVGANSRLQISLALERVVGPVVGGAIAKLTPFLGFLFAAIGHFVAAIFIILVHVEKAPNSSTARLSWHDDIKSGLRLLFEIRMLRPVILSSCIGSLAVGMFYALLIFALIQSMRLDGITAGLMVSVIGASTLVISLFVPRLTRIVGAGWAMIWGIGSSALGFACFALGIIQLNISFTFVGLALVGVGTSLFSINQISVRQAVTPPEYLGRVNASRRFVVFAFLPIGSLLGGLLAQTTSVAVSIGVASAVMFASSLPLLVSPVKNYRLGGR